VSEGIAKIKSGSQFDLVNRTKGRENKIQGKLPKLVTENSELG
jgi:hypothetical protein